MKALKFVEGDFPAGFKAEAETFLFNGAAHRALQSERDWRSFYLLDEGRKKVVSSIHFLVAGAVAESPHKAPFGSIEFSPRLQPEHLFDFMSQAEHKLAGKNVRRIVVRHPPQAYHPHTTAIAEALFNSLGYRVTNAEINVSIDVAQKKFADGLDKWEVRKRTQAKKAGLAFRPMPLGSLPEIYEFIADCRTERNQSLSMTFQELQTTTLTCVGKFFLFGVFQKNELAAAAITIQVGKKILYNFYSAHPRRMDHLSPVVLLTEGLYDWCFQHKIELLDLGTCALGKNPNFGLLDFKLRLGGNPSIRYTYEKEIH